MKKTIEIPEGYKARIEGNKVILEPKESEDERIRKEISKFLKNIHDDNLENRRFIADRYGDAIPDDMIPTWLAWLEKQGPQKLANSEKTCKDEPKSDWNNNDEINFNRLMAICADERVRKSSAFSEKEIKDLMAWFESIKKRVQPQWKPTKQQMEALKVQVEEGFGGPLSQLYNDLKALCNK